MDTDFLRERVGPALAKAIAAAADAGADDKINFVADWLLNYTAVEDREAALREQAAAVAKATATLQAEADAKAAAAEAAEASRIAAIGEIASLAEVLRDDGLPTELQAGVPAAYEACFAALMSESTFTAAYIAEVDYGALSVPDGEEAAEGSEPTGPVSLRYVAASSGQEFVVGQKLERGTGVSFAAAANEVVCVDNVLQTPSLKFLKLPRAGAFACVPIPNPVDGTVLAVLGADTLSDGAIVQDKDIETLVAFGKALGTVHQAGVAKTCADVQAHCLASIPAVGDYTSPNPKAFLAWDPQATVDTEPEPQSPPGEDEKSAWMADKLSQYVETRKSEAAAKDGVELEAEAEPEADSEPEPAGPVDWAADFDVSAAEAEYNGLSDEEKRKPLAHANNMALWLDEAETTFQPDDSEEGSTWETANIGGLQAKRAEWDAMEAEAQEAACAKIRTDRAAAAALAAKRAELAADVTSARETKARIEADWQRCTGLDASLLAAIENFGQISEVDGILRIGSPSALPSVLKAFLYLTTKCAPSTVRKWADCRAAAGNIGEKMLGFDSAEKLSVQCLTRAQTALVAVSSDEVANFEVAPLLVYCWCVASLELYKATDAAREENIEAPPDEDNEGTQLEDDDTPPEPTPAATPEPEPEPEPEPDADA